MPFNAYTSGYCFVNSLPFLGEEKVGRRAQTQPSGGDSGSPPPRSPTPELPAGEQLRTAGGSLLPSGGGEEVQAEPREQAAPATGPDLGKRSSHSSQRLALRRSSGLAGGVLAFYTVSPVTEAW